MSWGGVSAGLLFDIMKLEGYMYQLPLFLTPPEFTLDEKYICDVYCGYNVELDEYGAQNTGMISHVDHPAFTTLRDVLETRGYIKTQRNWSNGDVVLHDFWLNDWYFQAGQQFPCAAAMGNQMRIAKKKPELYEEELKSDYLPVRVPWKEEINDDKGEIEW